MLPMTTVYLEDSSENSSGMAVQMTILNQILSTMLTKRKTLSHPRLVFDFVLYISMFEWV